MRGPRGVGFIEILLVLVAIAVAGYVLMQYVGSTTQSVEKLRQEQPLPNAKLVADQATLDTVRAAVRVYQTEQGRWPADKAAVLGLLPSPPRFQCPGNDFEYDAPTGSLRLAITDAGRCS